MMMISLRKLLITGFVVAILGGIAVSYVYESTPPAPEDEQANSQSQQEVSPPPQVSEQDEAKAEAEPESAPSETTEPSNQERPSEETVTIEQCADYMSPACRAAAQDREFAMAVLKHQVETNPRAQRYMRAIEMQMAPFRFEGRVVNRQGEPIEGAEVVYQIGYPYSLGYEEPATVMTDEHGRFSLKGRGYSLFIRTIRHPGFTTAPGFQKNREFGSDQRKGHVSWSQATAESPKEFVLMRGRAFE